MTRHTVDRLTSKEATVRRYSHLFWRVMKGRSLRSTSSSLLERSSSFGFEPGLFLGASEHPSSASLTDERLTEKVRAAWLLPIPRLRASMFFSLRSSEYAFISMMPDRSSTLQRAVGGDLRQHAGLGIGKGDRARQGGRRETARRRLMRGESEPAVPSPQQVSSSAGCLGLCASRLCGSRRW
jgi:hypothetical protein